jgi:hypothetical protein
LEGRLKDDKSEREVAGSFAKSERRPVEEDKRKTEAFPPNVKELGG